MSTSEDAKPRVSKTSACLCRSISFTVTGEDHGAVICHCRNYSRASGSAFAHNHRFMNAQIEFSKGQDALREYVDSETKSGNALKRRFCGKCGSSMYLSGERVEGMVVLHCGTMEGGSEQPLGELFEEEKPAWLGDVTGKPK